MAKYSQDLFDEIIVEMTREKKSFLEMMAELDVDEQAIFDAQDRIAKKTQEKTLHSDKSDSGSEKQLEKKQKGKK